MMSAPGRAFNGGRPYHGSDKVSEGRLRGQTDTDYFYFLCPQCADNKIMQILEFDVVKDGPVEYSPDTRPKAKRDFIIAFKLWCYRCHLTDFVKISNIGWQGGKITNGLLEIPGLYSKDQSAKQT